jgi:glycosyltransferase involved in cell wall biosynthesis
MAFVQHSVTAWDGNMEGLPLAIIEAQMSGKPVISTVHAGIPDIVAHGETGFLVAEKDVKGMAEYMSKMATDSELVSQMGTRARERALERFTLQQHIQGIQKQLDAL